MPADRDENQQPAGPWRCDHFGFVWTGDISNHHGIESPAFCPGPHVRDEMGPLLRRLHEGWRLRRDGSLVPPPLPDLRDRLTDQFGGENLGGLVGENRQIDTGQPVDPRGE